MNDLYLFQLIKAGSNEAASESGSTFFPFTIIYGVLHYDYIELPRLLGLFRESGIAQMFMIWALYNLKSIGLNKLWIKVLLIVGVILTFSTAGIAVLCINMVAQQLLNFKILRDFLMIAVAYSVIIYAPFIGLEDKQDTGHGKSISDRQVATFNAWETLKEHPLGVGFNNSKVSYSGINLLGASNMIGVIGFTLCLGTYLLPMLAADNRKRYFLAVLPIIITSLTSQPLLDAPFLYIMFLAPYVADETSVVAKIKLRYKVPVKSGQLRSSVN
jgi:hypothetical protein